MKRSILFIVALCSFATIPSISAAQNARRERAFDADWFFVQGDISNAEQGTFDDSKWQRIDVPHDWAIAGPFDQKAPAGGAGAFLPSGVAWYRKHFQLDLAEKGRRFYVEFDGVMEKSGVWINGMHIGHRPNGYSSFRYDVTPHLKFGAGRENVNVIAVRADTEAQPASRWYAGGGIYRHVRMIVTGDVHVDEWGTYVTTPIAKPERASIHVESTVANRSKTNRIAFIDVAIVDANGRTVAQNKSSPSSVRQSDSLKFSLDLNLDKPRLWDTSDPALYDAVVRVVAENGTVLDTDRVTFGIREARFESASGFWLNGRNIKLKGVALHADAGPLGMAAPLSFWKRRLKNFQSLGVNAIRTAHHPFNPEVLDLCDRLGIIVMNEAFDMWTVAKNPFDYHLFFTDWSSIDARDFVKRDRNHPSVVIWSIGNEIHDTPYPLVTKSIIERLMNIFHEEDPSRPVTQALFRPNTTGDYQNGVADMLDVVGQNYRENELTAAHKEKPTRKIIGTENSKNRESWLGVRDYAPYAGMFLWSGADYLGEADRMGWPAISNPSGIVDRLDRVKPIGLERASWWSETPVVYLARRVTEQFDNSAIPTMTAVAMPAPKGPGALADWTPANLSTHDEKVEVYSNAQEVELSLNGKSLGRKPRNADDAARTWTVPFAAGEISARAFNNGKLVATTSLRTAGKPAAIKLIAEQSSIGRGFDELGFVRVEVVDDKGIVVPNATNEIDLKVGGVGVLAAFDNGDVYDHTAFSSPRRKVLEGHALAILRAKEVGSISIEATSPGLKSHKVSITAK